MEKFTFLKSEDGEIFILKKDYPSFLCRVNTIIPFDISIIISDLLDKRRFDGILPELEKFTIEKVKDLEG
jgi:hypothetical protein